MERKKRTLCKIVNVSMFLLLFACMSRCECKDSNLETRSSLEKKIGYKVKSMIVVGFRDEDIDEAISKNKFGGVIFFAEDFLTKTPRNAYSKDILLKNMQKLKKANIKFIAVDQEGGKAIDNGIVLDIKYRGVNRLYNIDKFNDMPFPESLSKMTSTKRKSTIALYAQKIKNLGFSVNFVPSVDIKINKDPNFFLNKKHRLLGQDSKTVVHIARDIIDIHHKSRLLTSVKHFPGHGSAMSNTHTGFVDVTNVWTEIELEPYKSLISENKVDMVMVGHLFNKNIDSRFPASMSYNTITKILRQKLKYDGVVISDAIDMYALSQNYTLNDIVVNMINAGTDIILDANQMRYDKDIAEKIYNIIIDNVLTGKISKATIYKSYERISSMLSKT